MKSLINALVISILCLHVHSVAIAQAADNPLAGPGGVTGALLWEKQVEPEAYKAFAPGLFNYHPYLVFDEDRVSVDQPLASFEDFSFFIVFSSNLPSSIGKIVSPYKEIHFTDSTVIANKSYGYEKVGALPKFLRFTQALRPSEKTKKRNQPKLFIGSEKVNKNWFEGGVAELIVFDRILSKQHKNQVESYLSIKYGLSLPLSSSYYNSSGETIWEPDTSSAYIHQVIALGKDAGSGLDQKQTHNQYTELDLQFSQGVLASLNQDNSQNLVNNTYLFIADNNKDSQLRQAISRANSDMKVMEKNWKIFPVNDFNYSETRVKVALNTLEGYDSDLPLWLVVDETEQDLNLQDAEQCQLFSIDQGYAEGRLSTQTSSADPFYFTLAQAPALLGINNYKECKTETVDIELDIQNPLKKEYDLTIKKDNKEVLALEGSSESVLELFDFPYGHYELELTQLGQNYSSNLELNKADCLDLQTGLQVYPNPVSVTGKVNFSVKQVAADEEGQVLSISNASNGRLIKKYSIPPKGLFLTEQFENAGTYLITLVSKGNKLSKKLIVVD